MLAARSLRFGASALLLLAAGAGAAAGPRGTSPTPAVVESPSSDAELLAAMHEDYVGLAAARGKARTVLGELNVARYDEQLLTLARAGGGAGDEAEAARQKLLSAWHRLYGAVGGAQPVDPRSACRRQDRTLREALAGAPGSVTAARLPEARAEARDCLARLSRSLGQTRACEAELDEALAAAKALLAAAPAAEAGAAHAEQPPPPAAREP
jgi:hypothetical protein